MEGRGNRKSGVNRKHFASNCKLSQGEDFAAKLGPVVIIKDVNDKEMKYLRGFFESIPPFMAGDAAAAATFAVVALGGGRAPIDNADSVAAKFVLKLKSRRLARLAAEGLESGDPAALATPRAATGASDSLHLPGIHSRPGTNGMALPVPPPSARPPAADRAGPGATPRENQPENEKADDGPVSPPLRGLHDPVSPRELLDARAPVRMTVRDCLANGGSTPRRLCKKLAGAEGQTHYDYFARCLPNESPEKRQAMRHRIAVQRGAHSAAGRSPDCSPRKDRDLYACHDSAAPTAS